jgi:uncharacterized protein (DUF849 family)
LNIKEWAGKVRHLQNDPVFSEVLKKIREQQVEVFLNAGSQDSDLMSAHDIIRALDKIEGYFNSVLSEEAIFDKRQQRKESAPWKRLSR